ncbi:flagellin N-terminal helical domain-containing protein [Roseinatronobacter sp.]
MTSILTNNSAMNALTTLRNINNNLGTTQDRISTGLKVASGKDNAAYFSISSTMKGDSGMIKSIDEGLALTKNAVSTARLGAETVADLAREFVERVAFAQGSGVDLEKVQLELDALAENIDAIVSQSTFNGASLVQAGNDDITAVTGISRGADGEFGDLTTITIEAVDLEAIQAALEDIDLTEAADADELADLLADAEEQLKAAVDAATSFGVSEKAIETQQTFLGELSNRLDSGIGSMIDADMEEEAARLQALQVQQQLATQALSIANQGPQNILSLFR